MKSSLQLLNSIFNDCQAKILDHDNVNYLKKILLELAMVLDQVEAELEKRKLEYQGTSTYLFYRNGSKITSPTPFFFMNFSSTLQVRSASCGYVDLNLR